MSRSFTPRWPALMAGKPGRRFEDRYEAARENRRRGDWGHRFRRLLLLVAAIGAIMVGVVLAFIPGPAIVFFFLAGTLLAAESRFVARLLDWGEVKLRIGWIWGRGRWDRLPGWGRAILLVTVAGLGAASMYLSYWLAFR